MIAGMTHDYSDSNPALGALYSRHLDILLARYDAALERVGAGHAVIYSGKPRQSFLDDRAYPYVPNPHFLSWLPVTDAPQSYLVYTPGEKPVLIFYQPHDYWHRVPDEPSGYWTGFFDIRVIHERAEAERHLPESLDKCVFLGEIGDPAATCSIERVNPESLINLLHYARGIKTDYELECMRLASRRAVAGHLAAEAAFRAGLSEFGIHQAYCKATSHTDADLPYDNIIALNRNGATLHYTALEREAPAALRSFLIDAGAQVHGYAADITRTHAFEDPYFADLVLRMDAMQKTIVAEVRQGVDFRQLQIMTHRHLADLLVDAELASGNADTLLSTGVTSAFFPHGLGHLLGVQVHDVGGHQERPSGGNIDPPSGHPFLRLTRILEEDMVLTIEPGLYVIDMLLRQLKGTDGDQHVNWDTVDRLRPFGGIRIEDNVRVTASNPENLTRDAFAEIA